VFARAINLSSSHLRISSLGWFVLHAAYHHFKYTIIHIVTVAKPFSSRRKPYSEDFVKGANINRGNQGGVLDVNDLILNCLERETCLTCRQIAEVVDKIAQESGNEGWSLEAIRYHLNELMRKGRVKHQEQGYFIDRGWKKGQPKAFILVEVAKPTKRGDNYQKILIEEIQDEFDTGKHEGLNLISVDAVLGAEFSVIIVVYSDNIHYIGRFVKEYLLASELVMMTRTIMVWPSEPGESESA
jgi:hypothetical protein